MYKCFRLRLSALMTILSLIAVIAAHTDGEALYASADTNADHTVPTLTAIMYHSILKDPSRTGDYVITPDELEQDLSYFSKNGYETVTPEEIISYYDDGTPLPRKPLLITFDDGHLNNLTYALPLLEKYDMTAVINVVGSYTLNAEKENDPNPYYAYLTRNDIKSAIDSGHIFIGCHTYDMHKFDERKGASKLSYESTEDYFKAFSDDLDQFETLFINSGISPVVYAFPYGYCSEESYDILNNNGYRIILTCNERLNDLNTCNTNGIIVLNRINRSGIVQSDDFMQMHNIT